MHKASMQKSLSVPKKSSLHTGMNKSWVNQKVWISSSTSPARRNLSLSSMLMLYCLFFGYERFEILTMTSWVRLRSPVRNVAGFVLIMHRKPNNRQTVVNTLTFPVSPSEFQPTAPHPGSPGSPTERLQGGLPMVRLLPIVPLSVAPGVCSPLLNKRGIVFISRQRLNPSIAA